MFEIIPAIDILDGKAVRLTQGDYRQVTVYADPPAIFAQKWMAYGAKRLHLVDLDGARSGKPVNLKIIKEIRQSISCQLEVGGGIRTKEDVKKVLDLGINKVILGSIALKNRELTESLVKKYQDKIIIGIDAKEGLVATEGWLKTSKVKASDLLKEMAKIGVKTIIYTDISRDGMLAGPNIAAYRELSGQTNIAIIASGGISKREDIRDLQNIKGLAGVIVGKALYENKINLKELIND